MSDYFDSGFCVRTASWHRKENLIAEYPKDWNEARKLAGLEWDPIALPVYAYDGDLQADLLRLESDPLAGLDIAKNYREIPNQQRIVRSDTRADLGITTGSYNVIDHGEMGQIMEALLSQPGIKYDTAGSVRGGKQVWALAYLDEPVQVNGDPSITLPYVGLTTRHDGTGALRAQATDVRIVCANTFTAAEAKADRDGTAFTFSHKGKWQDRIEDAKEAIRGVRNAHHDYMELMNELAAIHVTRNQVEAFITEFIPAPPEGLTSNRVKTNVETARGALRTILASPTSEGVADTAYGLVQAAGEYLDHYREVRTMDSVLTRQLLKPQRLKGSAVKIVRGVVNA
jgi:phage/plasmid-like protein (TIGR03299 family)